MDYVAEATHTEVSEILTNFEVAENMRVPEGCSDFILLYKIICNIMEFLLL